MLERLSNEGYAVLLCEIVEGWDVPIRVGLCHPGEIIHAGDLRFSYAMEVVEPTQGTAHVIRYQEKEDGRIYGGYLGVQRISPVIYYGQGFYYGAHISFAVEALGKLSSQQLKKIREKALEQKPPLEIA